MSKIPIRVLAADAPDGSPKAKLSAPVIASSRPSALKRIVNTLTGTYTAQMMALLEQTWLELYDNGMLGALDQLTMPGMTEADSLLNWAGGAAAVNNGASWAVDIGFTTDGVSDWVNFSVNPSTAVHFQQNSMCLGLLIADASTQDTNDYLVGMDIGGTPDNIIRAKRIANNDINFRAQTTAADTILAYTGPLTGLFFSSRTASNVSKLYHDGALIGSLATASSVRRNGNLALGRQSTTFQPANARALVAGAGMSDAGAAEFYRLVWQYNTLFDVLRAA